MKNYTSIENIENYLLIEIDPAFEPQVEKWIEAMGIYIINETGREFGNLEDESPSELEFTEKLYDGDGERELFIDDCIEIDKIKVDGIEVDYLAYPANYLPITKVILTDSIFTKGNQNVEITAKWGYSEIVPTDINFACTVLVAGIINRSLSHEGEVQSKSVGPYSVTYKDEKSWDDFDTIKDTLSKYKKYNF